MVNAKATPNAMSRRSGRLFAGAPSPLGATWGGRGTNFALFSANAERVELCLFDPDGEREIERIALPERSGDIWHGYLDDIGIAYCGRYGDWGYLWTDESFKSGEAAADKALERLELSTRQAARV